MDAVATVRDYYEALRRGEPLYPYFAERADLVKYGLSERLAGYDAVAEGLREQSRSTTDWVIDSTALQVTERDRHAWFSDVVAMGWTDVERNVRFEFDSRWSGTLERRNGEWLFVGLHVSTTEAL